jgi:hypothetical protein
MNPVIIQDAISIAAASINENVIASNTALRGLLEAPYPSRIRLLAVISATGLRIDAAHSSSRYVASADLRVSSSTPDDPLDVVNDEAYTQAGEQQVLRVVNTTGGAITLRYMLIMEPLVDASWTGGQVELPPDCLVMQRGPVAIANNTVDQQLLDGLAFERNPSPSLLKVLMTQSAAGITRALYVDQDRIAPPSAISLNNRVPQDPFDMTINGVEVGPNSLQQLQVTNTSGGSLNVFWKTKNQQLIRP